MIFDDLRAKLLGADALRPGLWFSWHDDVPCGASAEEAAACGDVGSMDRRCATDLRSSNGRANGNGNRHDSVTTRPVELTSERVAELRRWIADGGHNELEVAEEVARRILESGEL